MDFNWDPYQEIMDLKTNQLLTDHNLQNIIRQHNSLAREVARLKTYSQEQQQEIARLNHLLEVK